MVNVSTDKFPLTLRDRESKAWTGTEEWIDAEIARMQKALENPMLEDKQTYVLRGEIKSLRRLKAHATR